MNHIYRLVWNHRTQTMVAVAENAKGRGKQGGKSRLISAAVAGALLAMAHGSAMAVAVNCNGGANTVSASLTGSCTLDQAGESLNVITGGTISGAETPAVSVTGSAADSITNSGMLSATHVTNGVNSPIVILGTLTGSIVNQSGGLIERTGNGSGGGAAIDVQGVGVVTGGIINQAGGNIVSDQYGILLRASAVSGGITNAGTISSGEAITGLFGAVVNGSVVNTGSGVINASFNGISLWNTTVTGSVRNDGSLISGSGIAMDISYGSTVAGDVANTGTITVGGASSGIGIKVSGNVNGALTNSGTISVLGVSAASSSSRAGVLVSSSTIVGGIVNSGTINGGDAGVALRSQVASNLTNQAGGTLTGRVGVDFGIRPIYQTSSTGFSPSATLTGSIINSGLITGTDGGIRVNGGTLDGSIVNTSGATITGGALSGIEVNSAAWAAYTFSSSLIGSGTLNSRVTGGITNSGQISGVRGINIDQASTITGGILNKTGGSISGTAGQGIGVFGASTIEGGITNQVGATISGKSGIAVSSSTIVGGITNSGHIAASFWAGVAVSNSTISGAIYNDGLISNSSALSHRPGIALGSNISIAGGLINASGGTISGVNDGVYVYGPNNTLNITNSGLITGGAQGILLSGSTFTGGIVNQAGGTISGGIAGSGSGTGINITSTSSLSNGIQNAAGGLILGGSAGIVVSSSSALSGGITNAGTIAGNDFSIVDEGATISSVVITGTTAKLLGDVKAVAADMVIRSGAVFANTNAISTNSFAVENGALFDFSAGPRTSGALGWGLVNDGITVANGFTNDGIVSVAAGVNPTISGNYAQSATGIYRIGLTDAVSNYGKLNVTGTANVAGGIDVVINGSPTIANGTTIAGVITSTGAMTVVPANIVVTDNSLFYNFTAATVSNPGNALDLITTVDANALTNAVGISNPSATGVAQNLQNIFNAGVPVGMQPIFDQLGNMTPTQISNAMSQLLPTLVGAGAQAGINALHSMNKLIQSRVESNQGLSSGEDTPDKYVWARGFGSRGDQSNVNGVSGYRSSTDGFGIGADAPINERVRAGVAVTYAKSHINGNSTIAPNFMKADTYELVGYASYNLDPQTDINYQIDIGQNKVSSTRQIAFMGTTAQASFDSLAMHGSAGIGRTFSLAPSTNLTPAVRLDYTQMRTAGYTETGAGASNLRVDASTYKEFVLTGDAKIAQQMTDSFKMVGNVSLGYDFLNKQSSSTSAFVGGGAVFESKGLLVSPWTYRAGLGAIYDSEKGIECSVRYDMEGRTSGYKNQTLSAKLRWAF